MTSSSSRARRALGSLALFVLPVILAAACESDTASPLGIECTLGQVIPCGNKKGCTQKCLPDLSAYGECLCGDAGASDGGKKDAR